MTFTFLTASARVDVPCSSIVTPFIVFTLVSIPVLSCLFIPTGSQYCNVLFVVAVSVVEEADCCFTNWSNVHDGSLLTSIRAIGIPINAAYSCILFVFNLPLESSKKSTLYPVCSLYRYDLILPSDLRSQKFFFNSTYILS
nr:MAG TPA: hypothetical protein [Caudoviricetes sp.]